MKKFQKGGIRRLLRGYRKKHGNLYRLETIPPYGFLYLRCDKSDWEAKLCVSLPWGWNVGCSIEGKGGTGMMLASHFLLSFVISGGSMDPSFRIRFRLLRSHNKRQHKLSDTVRASSSGACHPTLFGGSSPSRTASKLVAARFAIFILVFMLALPICGSVTTFGSVRRG